MILTIFTIFWGKLSVLFYHKDEQQGRVNDTYTNPMFSWEPQGTPSMPPPKKLPALSRDYSLNSRPAISWGFDTWVALGGYPVPLDCHDGCLAPLEVHLLPRFTSPPLWPLRIRMRGDGTRWDVWGVVEGR